VGVISRFFLAEGHAHRPTHVSEYGLRPNDAARFDFLGRRPQATVEMAFDEYCEPEMRNFKS
jgi:hypothetical protein